MKLDDLKLGDILLVKGDSLISKTIKKFTKSEYSHAACYLGNKAIIESDIGGVQVSKLSKFSEYTVLRPMDYTPEKSYDIISFMIDRIGCKYDYLGLVGIGYAIINKRKGNALDMKNRYWCSELVADAYMSVGYDFGLDKESHLISPQDLYSYKKFMVVGKDVKF